MQVTLVLGPTTPNEVNECFFNLEWVSKERVMQEYFVILY
jgi:hypothetical protein